MPLVSTPASRHWRTAPVEYALMRTAPQPWRLEDSVLVQLSMFIELQDGRGLQERRLALMADRLPGPLVEFLVSPGSDWDTSIDGTTLAPPRSPAPRSEPPRARARGGRQGEPSPQGPGPQQPRRSGFSGPAATTGSWPARTPRAGGTARERHAPRALGAEHLVPAAVLEWGDGGPEGATRLVGVTLPGVPALVVRQQRACRVGLHQHGRRLVGILVLGGARSR